MRGAKVSVPTPTVSDVHFEGHTRSVTKASPNRGVGLPLWAERIALLRTPTAAKVEGGPVSPAVAKAKGQTLRLTGQVLEFADWGQFAAAIQRWETVTARIAPEPTLRDGQKGQHRLSSKFTEWMMGLPDGWITGQGLHRKDEIKMAGNGVVPQQAKYALKILLDRVAQ